METSWRVELNAGPTREEFEATSLLFRSLLDFPSRSSNGGRDLDRRVKKLLRKCDNPPGVVSPNRGRKVGKQAATMDSPISIIPQYIHVEMSTIKRSLVEAFGYLKFGSYKYLASVKRNL